MNPKQLISFIRQTFGQEQDFIPLHDPRFIGNERKYINDALDSNFVSSVGEYVTKFEKACAEYTGAKYAVAAMNGTAALHISLMLAGVEQNNEVITQPLTFIATTNAIAYTGAHPVFIDVDNDTLGLSPEKLEHWLKENVVMKEAKSEAKAKAKAKAKANANPALANSLSLSLSPTYNKHTNRKIAAIVPVHTFGHPCRIDEIVEIAAKYNIPVIEDAAESLGSYYKNKHTGIFGDFGILSFNGNKIVTTGGGGMILTNNEDIAKLAKHITTTGKIPHPWEYRHDMLAYNYRLTNLAAALGCGQMEQLDFFVQEKRKLAQQYKEFFSNSGVEFFTEPNNSKSNYWLNAIILKNLEERNKFLKETNDNKVMTRPAWTLMNKLNMYKNCITGDLSNSQKLEETILNLPSSVIVENYYTERSKFA